MDSNTYSTIKKYRPNNNNKNAATPSFDKQKIIHCYQKEESEKKISDSSF